MGIATGQWRASVGCWQARFKFQLPGVNTNSLSTSAIFYALVLAVLLVVGGIEMNPGPNTQSCCELCGVNLDTMKERELALDQREEAVLVMLQQREAVYDAREQALEQREVLLQSREVCVVSREAAVGRREKLMAEKEKSPGTLAVNGDSGGVELVRTLLEQEMISKTGLLEWAVLNSYMTIACFLIKEAKADVNAKDSRGRSVLFLAVENGLLAAVKLLLPLSREATVDSAGNLAFHSAVSKGHTDVVKWLISDNRSLARMNNKNGSTALHLAAKYGHSNIVKFLYYDAQADVEVKNNCGLTALHFATRYGQLDIVKFLVQEAHSDVEVKDNLGFTALHFAAFCSHLSVAKFLVQEAQADVGCKTSDGKTALQLSKSAEMKNFLRQSS